MIRSVYATFIFAALSISLVCASAEITGDNKASSDQGASKTSRSRSTDGAAPDVLRVLILPVTAGDNKGAKERGDAPAEKLRDELIAHLTGSDRILVVDRTQMVAALKEIHRGQSAATEAATSPQVGRMLGAQKMIALSLVGNRFSLKLIDIEKMQVELARSAGLTETESVFRAVSEHAAHQALIRGFRVLMPQGESNIKVKLATAKKKYKKNERITFHLTVSENAYVNVLYIQSDGEVIVIFPNEHQPDNYVKSGSVVEIPSRESGYAFTAGEPFGTDLVKVIASRTKLSLFQQKKVDGTPFSRPDEKGERITRGIKKVVTGVGAKDWSAAELEVEVAE